MVTVKLLKRKRIIVLTLTEIEWRVAELGANACGITMEEDMQILIEASNSSSLDEIQRVLREAIS